MHAQQLITRVCPTCDGFPVVAISIGPRTPDGTLPTLPVVCLDCAGTGTLTTARPVPAQVGQ